MCRKSGEVSFLSLADSWAVPHTLRALLLSEHKCSLTLFYPLSLRLVQINIEQSGIKLRLLNYEVLKPKPRPTEEEGQEAFKPRVTEEEQDLVSE
jgi:hypothetical protein